MKIRKFKKEDAREVSMVIISAFKTFLGEKFDDVDEKVHSPSVYKKISLKKDFLSETISYVAEENGKIRGYIRGNARIEGVGSLEVLGVSPEYFGKGVGKKLFEKLEEFWRKKNLRKVTTSVAAHNKRAIIFYLKNGFIPVGYRKDHFRVGVDEILLDKFLDNG